MNKIQNATEIKRLRATLDLTQSELAKRLGVTQRTVAGWETGAKIPKVAQLALEGVARVESST